MTPEKQAGISYPFFFLYMPYFGLSQSTSFYQRRPNRQQFEFSIVKAFAYFLSNDHPAFIHSVNEKQIQKGKDPVPSFLYLFYIN